MKQINKRLTFTEKILFAVLAIFLTGLMYYYLVELPVKREMRKAEQAIADCQVLEPALQARLVELKKEESELEQIRNKAEKMSVIESYNNSEAEMKFMHTVLGSVSSYSINFLNVKRDGNLIRRDLEVAYSAESYEAARKIIEDFAGCSYRCIVSAVRMSDLSGETAVSCTITFYETMVGGDSDSGLPSDGEGR